MTAENSRSGAIRPGEVFAYPFLWAHQQEAGETGGRKARPACLAVTAKTAIGETVLFILPISTQPHPGRAVLRVPEIEAKRAGLDSRRTSFVVLDEINVDILERSWVFEDRSPMGAFSPSFAGKLRAALLEVTKGGSAAFVRRME